MPQLPFPLLTLTRSPSTEHGTFGSLLTYHTLELPWRNNASRISCIPAGIYSCIWRVSSKFGWVFEVTNVPSRSGILIHPANFAADKSKPELKSELLGCIALGLTKGKVNSQAAIFGSRLAVQEFAAKLNRSPFTLEITN